MLDAFTAVWIPLLVVMSPLTVLPLFLSMAEDLDPAEERLLARRGVITAFFVAVGVTLAGQGLFRLLDITVDDLRVAGGIVLILIALHDLIYSRERRQARESADAVGVVPLGTPVIVGPATLTACLVLADVHGRLFVLVSLVINLSFTAVVLFNAHRLVRLLRPGVVRAFGKVMSLFLAAIAVAMIRNGIAGFIRA